MSTTYIDTLWAQFEQLHRTVRFTPRAIMLHHDSFAKLVDEMRRSFAIVHRRDPDHLLLFGLPVVLNDTLPKDELWLSAHEPLARRAPGIGGALWVAKRDDFEAFHDAHGPDTIEAMERKMNAAAAAEDYDTAIKYRDMINARTKTKNP